MTLPVPVRAVRVVRLPNGESSLEVNLLGLQQPSDSYHADWYWTDSGAGSAKFYFGKVSVGGQRLVKVLEVSIAKRALQAIRATLDSKNFVGALGEFVEKNDLAYSPPKLPVTNFLDAGTKEFSVVATFAFIGFTENDAAISLFRMPPGADLIAGTDPSKILIQPLVRIDTSASILQAFCKDIISHVDTGRAT